MLLYINSNSMNTLICSYNIQDYRFSHKIPIFLELSLILTLLQNVNYQKGLV